MFFCFGARSDIAPRKPIFPHVRPGLVFGVIRACGQGLGLLEVFFLDTLLLVKHPVLAYGAHLGAYTAGVAASLGEILGHLQAGHFIVIASYAVIAPIESFLGTAATA